MLHTNIGVNAAGHLTFAGVDTTELAARFGTPLYLLDEGRVRARAREYVETMRECMPEGSAPLYAGKALSFAGIYRVVCSEGMNIDVVSQGEIATALAAGADPARMFFHGNNKTDAEIAYAIAHRIGHFIVDGFDELYAVDRAAAEAGVVQRVLLRLTPGIDPHTFEAVNTGMDCQFGVQMDRAMEFLSEALECEHLSVVGLHCHIGSQVFDAQPFLDAADIMLSFMADALTLRGFIPEYLDLGGGFGVRYTEDDPFVDIPAEIRRIAERVREGVRARGLFEPAILLEPGRSIVADAGMTLYTVGQVKPGTDGAKNYVTVDGGMSDDPRFALYGSRYTVYPASRMNEERELVWTVAGRCCESGDVVAENVALPAPRRGDLLAVAVTGAYNFSMASNYNRVCRPALVMLRGGEARVGVRRETPEDIMARDVLD